MVIPLIPAPRMAMCLAGIVKKDTMVVGDLQLGLRIAAKARRPKESQGQDFKGTVSLRDRTQILAEWKLKTDFVTFFII